MTAGPRPKRRHGIGARLTFIVAGVVLAAMVLAFNVEGWVARALTLDFAFVDAQELAALREERPGERLVDERGRPLMSYEEYQVLARQRSIYVHLGLGIVGVSLALGVGFVVSRRVTRRVRALAVAVSQPVQSGQDLPGPFPLGRPDEIGVLAGALNDMRDRIQGLVKELERQDRDRRDWIAMVSHDLRNPLQALTACIDRASEEGGKIRDDVRRETMQRLLSTARLDVDRFRALTLDLLDIARLDVPDALTLEPVPPGEVARTIVQALRVLAEQQGRTLEANVAPRCPELLADGRRLLRALENLLRNAIQHAESSVVLQVAPTEAPSGPALRFSVEDDGPGLPLEGDAPVAIGRLGQYKSRDDSAGLGLVVVRKVAEAHGGRVGGFNRPLAAPQGGRRFAGATVWFEIPLPQPGELAEELAGGLDDDDDLED